MTVSNARRTGFLTTISFALSSLVIDKNDIVGNVDPIFCNANENYTLVDTARFPNLNDLNADCLVAATQQQLDAESTTTAAADKEELEVICTCCSECF